MSGFPAQLPGQGGGVEMSVSRQHRQGFMSGYPRNFEDVKQTQLKQPRRGFMPQVMKTHVLYPGFNRSHRHPFRESVGRDTENGP